MAITISGENNNDRILAQDGVIDQISGINIVGVLTATTFSGDFIGDLTGNVTGNINNSTLLLQTGGYERLRIDSNGRIGLGINNPGSYFSSYNRVVMGRTNDTGGMTIVSAPTSGGYIAFADGTSGNEAYRGRISYYHNLDALAFNTAATERVRIDSSGDIGIGTDNPAVKLDVRGHIKVDDGPVLENSASGDVLKISNSTGYLDVGSKNTSYVHFTTDRPRFYFGRRIVVDEGIVASYNEDLVLATDITEERIRIKNDTGNVGIGSADPGGVLDLYHATSNTILNVKSGDSGSVINLIDNATRSSIEQNGTSLKIISDTVGSYANSDIRLQVDGSTKMLINSTGKVGINETSPLGTLHIKEGDSGLGAANANADTVFIENSANAGITIATPNTNTGYLTFADPEDDNVGMIIYRHGGSNANSMGFFVNASERLRITSDGQIIVNGTTNLGHPNMDDIVVGNGTGNRGITIASGTSNYASVAFGDSSDASGADRYEGLIEYYHNNDSLTLYTAHTPKLRITSSGDITQTGSVYTIDSTGSAGVSLDRGNTSSGATIDFKTAGALKWYTGLRGLVNDNFYLRNEVGSEDSITITTDGYIGINDTVPYTGLTINKEGDYWDTNGNTYAHPEGRVLSTWRGDRDNDTDYWVGFIGKYLKPSATVNILLQPHVGNFNNQAGMYIAGEATGNFSSDFTLGKIVSGNVAGRGTTASSGKRASKSELFRITNSGHVKFNSGFGSVTTVYGCRAWVKLNQTGAQTVNASGGVSSIADLGTGHTQVNFTTAMPDRHYAMVGGAQQSGTYSSANNYCFSLCMQGRNTTNANFIYRPTASSDVKEDNSQVDVAFFR